VTQPHEPIRFVVPPELADKYRNYIGKVIDWWPAGQVMIAAGFRGQLLGAPGELRRGDDGGLEWHIEPVDMRTPARKKLDKAAELLAVMPKVGEPLVEIEMRQATARHLMLLAELDMLRRMEARS
jgi:hypothetical protein